MTDFREDKLGIEQPNDISDYDKEKIIEVRCIHCGYEKKYKSKNTQLCHIKSKGHKPHHKFSIKFTK